MMAWDPNLYLQFGAERNRATTDLIAQINLQNPRTIADLGCGPGNSTALLHARWPDADIIGVDNSAEMLAEARKQYPDWQWEQADLECWLPARQYDLVFSNATLHWLHDHATLVPRLFAHVAAGGVFAAQLPHHGLSPAHQVIREASKAFYLEARLKAARERMTVESPEFYYDALATLAKRVDVWVTTYYHEMQNVEGVLEWLRGTGLRPYLDALAPEEQQQLKRECLARFQQLFATRADGKVLLPYPRIFIVAAR
jgi:trans-aconitate 2-methyltransferase